MIGKGDAFDTEYMQKAFSNALERTKFVFEPGYEWLGRQHTNDARNGVNIVMRDFPDEDFCVSVYQKNYEK